MYQHIILITHAFMSHSIGYLVGVAAATAAIRVGR